MDSVRSTLLYLPLCPCFYVSSQPSVPVPAKMEGPAQLLTLAHVMWGGLECSVKQVQYRALLGSVTLSYHSPVHSVIVSSPVIECGDCRNTKYCNHWWEYPKVTNNCLEICESFWIVWMDWNHVEAIFCLCTVATQDCSHVHRWCRYMNIIYYKNEHHRTIVYAQVHLVFDVMCSAHVKSFRSSYSTHSGTYENSKKWRTHFLVQPSVQNN